ncbi:thioredoxin domain-containing protein 11 [Venturia canescens]|uniref:thioredoxin domain-containing protein 11 n=1 Tax=Venturia canescens TaxID=32260 RepID=UPI001C9CB871|nr:thioredoxin domain-containing protein 11 [Venturia canescens]
MLSVEEDSSTPRNVDDSEQPATQSENSDVARTRRSSIEERLASKMFSYSREIICLYVAVTLTLGFAAIHSAPPRISKPPAAQPFFNQSSVILDFYKGHLEAMVKRTSDADLSFVMYYAPWDAESQAVRHEFETVAQYYYSKIFFAAINCWHPGSQCRAQYNKIQSYPVLILYPSRDTPIEYRGINTAPYMIRFLESFIHPINRITKREELAQLLVESDAVVVGFIDFKGLSISPGYKEFYRTATRFLGRDPNRDVTFALVTDVQTASKEFGIYNFPSAILSMWNETLIFSTEKMWTTQNLLNWIGGSMHKVALWLQPPGVKSLTLAPYMRDGPVLFLFTPRNPLHDSNYNFKLLREVALQYYSCDDILLTENLVERLRENIRQGAAKHRQASQKCAEVLKERNSRSDAPTVSVFIQRWINDSCCARVVMNKCLSCKKTLGTNSNVESGVCSMSEGSIQEICKGLDVFKAAENGEEFEKHQFCCGGDRNWNANLNEESSDSRENYKSSVPTNEKDPRSALGVKATFFKDQCIKFLAGNKYHYPIFPKVTGDTHQSKVTASACRMNKTLALIAIDSVQYFHFAEGLGIDILKMKDKTAVVILDADQESQYLMKQPYNRESLINFINQYTEGVLQRTLRSESSKRFAHDFKSRRGCENIKETEICIRELNAETFLDAVLDPKMDVVVMYHSPYCAFCSAIAYVYLTVAKYLSKMDHLTFVRIDGDNNDLPWEYSMDRYPSILFFPAKRKEDSTVYPFALPITIRNLLNYVLANLEGDSHVEALVNICSYGSGEPPQDCVARTRRLCLEIIDKLLMNYRRSRRSRESLSKKRASHVRREILLKLEHMREVHLILGSVDNLRTEDGKLEQIRQKFKTYYKNLAALGKHSYKKSHSPSKDKAGNAVIVESQRKEDKNLKDEL